MRVVQRPCFFHDADAPIKVGREAVLHIVGYGQTSFSEESLMTNKHPLLETLPCQHFGCGEAAHTEEMPLFINQSRFTINYVRQFTNSQGMYHLLQSVIFVETVSGIEETEIVAGCQVDAFVHGIVQSLVRFADDLRNAVTIPFGNGEGSVFGSTVYNDVLYVVVGLGDHT